MSAPGKPRWQGKATPRPSKMNGTEAAYAAHLEAERLAGRVLRWDFEAEKLRLADLTFYTPDFRVLMSDHSIQFHEVKGFFRDDARVKIKVAAEHHPYVFVVVRARSKKAGGGWDIEKL